MSSMKKQQKKKKKFEFSKVVAVIAILMWLTVNLFGMAMTAMTYDLTALVYIIGSVDAVVAIVLGFYYGKAKAENQIKLKIAYGELADEVAKENPPAGYETWGN